MCFSHVFFPFDTPFQYIFPPTIRLFDKVDNLDEGEKFLFFFHPKIVLYCWGKNSQIPSKKSVSPSPNQKIIVVFLYPCMVGRFLFSCLST